MGKLKVMALVGVGYVLGARAGRERYEQIKAKAQQFSRNPKVRDAAARAEDTVREQAPVVKDKVSDVANTAKSKVGRHPSDKGTGSSSTGATTAGTAGSGVTGTGVTGTGATAPGASSTGFPADPEQPRP